MITTVLNIIATVASVGFIYIEGMMFAMAYCDYLDRKNYVSGSFSGVGGGTGNSQITLF